jgi:hypothetical protein
MMIQYRYFSWSPPHLSAAEEIELGRLIATHGREEFVRDFRERMEKGHLKNRPAPTGIAAWPKEVRYMILVVLFGVGAIYIVRAGLMEQAVGTCVPIIVIVSLVYYGSMFFAMRRFNRWLDRLIARYAESVAKGTK